jgi:hypothetical protein
VTTPAEQLLRTLEVRCVRLTVVDGRLHTSSNPSCLRPGTWGDGTPASPCECVAITPILAEGIRRHHDELVTLVTHPISHRPARIGT